MNLIPYLIAWIIAAAGVAALAIYRKMAAGKADDVLHLGDQEVGAISAQAAVAKQTEQIDRWGKILTLLVALAGLALLGAYLYQSWLQSSRLPQ